MKNQAMAHTGIAQAATVFEWPVRVYWEDTDAGGIVYYANQLKFFERARTEWLRHLGLGQQHLRDTTGGMFVVTDVQLKYHSPARLDELLCVSTQLQACGRASLQLHQQSWRTTPSPHPTPERQLLCAAQVRIGWVGAQDMRPQRMPEPVYQAFASFCP